MRQAIVFDARREGYGIDQIADRAITVGELKELLEDWDDDTLFVLSHDNGYTYGSISKWDGVLFEEQPDGDFEEV